MSILFHTGIGSVRMNSSDRYESSIGLLRPDTSPERCLSHNALISYSTANPPLLLYLHGDGAMTESLQPLLTAIQALKLNLLLPMINLVTYSAKDTPEKR
jgi:hypothetical protein